MKAKISCVLAVCFVLGLLPLAINAQEPEKRYQMFWVIDEVVKPSMANEYYEAGKKMGGSIEKIRISGSFQCLLDRRPSCLVGYSNQ